MVRLPGTLLEEGSVPGRVALIEPECGAELVLSSFRQRCGLVLCFLHPACQDCRSFAAQLAALEDDIAWADARAWAIVERPDELALPVLLDPNNAARRVLVGKENEDPVIVVFDRYGAASASFPVSAHVFPAARWIAETVIHLATKCEECGVPHWPDEAN